MVSFRSISRITFLYLLVSSQSMFAADGLNFSKVKNLLSEDVYVHSSTPLTIYQFFASWCIGCSETMKSIEKYTLPKEGSGLSYRVVSIDEKRSDGVEYYNKKIKGKVERIDAFLWDPTLSLADKLKIDTIPFVALVDAGGAVLWSHTGEMKEKGTIQLRALVESHLEKMKSRTSDSDKKTTVNVVDDSAKKPLVSPVVDSGSKKSPAGTTRSEKVPVIKKDKSLVPAEKKK